MREVIVILILASMIHVASGVAINTLDVQIPTPPFPTPTIPTAPIPTETPQAPMPATPTPTPPIQPTQPTFTPPQEIPTLPKKLKLKPIVIVDLHPKYFVVGDDESYDVKGFAIDESGIKTAKLLYMVDDGGWKEVKANINTIQSIPGLTFSKLPVFYEIKGTIPPQKAGNVIFYKFVVKDLDGNEVESPTGMFFVVDDENNMKVMIVDPSIELWLLKQNAEKFAEIQSKSADYGMISDEFNEFYQQAKKVEKFDLIKRHYWQRLQYNFIVVSPNEVKEALDWNPNVIILSNLMLENWVVPHELVDYARKNNAGIIATHGTLFDEVVWNADTRKDAKVVGARQHVGDTIEAYKDETIALLFGFKLSPALEFARDRVAESLCTNPNTKAAGKALGSTPLFPVYIPFSGKLIVKEKHEVLNGLGNEFSISIPNYQINNMKSYTLFGWQYVAPSSFNKTKERAKIVKEKAEKFYDELKTFLKEYVGVDVNKDSMLSSLDSEFLDVANNVEINENVKLKLKGKEITVDGNAANIAKLSKLVPAKVVVVSDDYLAGIVVNDEWYRSDGLRSVYITFEGEASKDDAAWKIIENSVVWTSKFEYQPEKVGEEIKQLLTNMRLERAESKPGAFPSIPKIPGFDVFVCIISFSACLLIRRCLK